MKSKMFQILVLLVLYNNAWGDPAQPSVDWGNLAPEVQTLLQPLQSTWSDIPQGRKTFLVKGANRWQASDENDRARMKKRFIFWNNLPAIKKKLVRNRFKQFNALPKNEQESVRKIFRKFRKLPLKKRQKLRDEWNSKSMQERRFIKQRIKKRILQQRRKMR